MLFAAEGDTIEMKCRIAGQLLERFVKVPVAYLKAISSPLLHSLAGIRSSLGSVFEEPLPKTSYLEICAVLLAMADLLANLETGLYCTAGASERLRSNVSRIDSYMQEQRQLTVSLQVFEAKENTNLIENPKAINEVTIPSSISFEPSYQQFQLLSEFLQDWPWLSILDLLWIIVASLAGIKRLSDKSRSSNCGFATLAQYLGIIGVLATCRVGCLRCDPGVKICHVARRVDEP